MAEQRRIDDSRKEIDRLDDEILTLLNERSRHVIAIGKAKRQADPNALLHTPGREAEILIDWATRQVNSIVIRDSYTANPGIQVFS